MVAGIGGSGDAQSLQNCSTYRLYYLQYQSYMQKNPSSSCSFEGWLIKEGKIGYFTQQLENFIETGDENLGDGQKGNTLDCGKHVMNGTAAIYQGQDEDTFYEFDYDAGTYRVLHGNKEIAQALGVSSDQNVDTVTMGHRNAAVTDYTFGGLDDGQDKTVKTGGSSYGGVTYIDQEFDIDYILNSLLMDPSDPQYQIAKGIFDDLCEHTSQWLKPGDLDDLNKTADEFGTNSEEYKAKLKEVLRNNLDQAQEWVDDHAHVKNTSSSTEIGGTDGAGSTDGTDGAEEQGTVPDYDKSKVLDQAGMLADYTNNTSHKCDSINLKGKSSGQARNEALGKASEYASAVLDQTISALTAQLGDQYTDEMQTYISKAKEATLADTSSWRDYKYDGGLLRKNKHYTGYVKTQPLINKFFEEFNALCANKGKTTEEVEAEQKAKEEQAEKEKAVYQSLYNMDMSSTANEAGVDPNKDFQIVDNTGLTAQDIKDKVESQVLAPLKNKIRSKLAGQGVSDTVIQTVLDNASKYALSDTTAYGSTSNNVTYTIDTSKVIELFQSAVKKSVEAKGYEF